MYTMIYLIDWAQANWLMGVTALVIIGIPEVVLFMVLSRKSKSAKKEKEGEASKADS